MTNTTTTTNNGTAINYPYGDSVTVIPLPLPLCHQYTKGQQALVDAVLAKGWALDETAVHNTYGYRLDEIKDADHRRSFLKQHPFKFVRQAADGGWWELELDYVSREYSSYDNRGFGKTLLGAKLSRYTAEADEVLFDGALSGYPDYRSQKGQVVLQKQSTAGWASRNWVTAVAAQGGNDTLRDQVLALATDPDLVVWLAAERKFTTNKASRERGIGPDCAEKMGW